MRLNASKQVYCPVCHPSTVITFTVRSVRKQSGQCTKCSTIVTLVRKAKEAWEDSILFYEASDGRKGYVL